jgi:excisionase family DNA binding protein
MEKMLLTPTEAATTLGIGRSKLYELMRAGVVPSVRIGASRRIASTDLLDLVAGLRTAGDGRL